MKSPVPAIILSSFFALLGSPVALSVIALPGSAGILTDADDSEWSKDMKEGARLIAEGLDEQAFEKFALASRSGELVAYHMLGVMHRDGRGTERDLVLAKECFIKAASEGDSFAGQELALLRFAAPSDSGEFSTARAQLEKFAQDGKSRPQLQLGIANLEGYGFTADAAKATKYLKSAASGDGHAKAEAAYLLGKLYRDGHKDPDVDSDMEKAEFWLRIAAEKRHPRAVAALGEFYLSSDFGNQDYAEARRWFSRLDKLGNPAGSCFMGLMSENGWGVDEDAKTALRFYEVAAAGNVPLAVYKLANFHENGRGGLVKDKRRAMELYRKGAELGHAVCMYNLSGLLEELGGNTPEVNSEISIWLLRAASAGLTEAEYRIGLRYQKSQGVPQDLVAAAAWFDRAARSGHALAQLHLGEMFENGHGVKRDYRAARRLFKLSAANGHLGGQVKYAFALANGIGGAQDLIMAYVFAEAATRVAPDARLAVKVRDAVKESLTAEQLAEAEEKISALDPGID